MKFTKMHGCCNDYIFVNEFEETVEGNREELVRAMSDRNRGVGGDGAIFIKPCAGVDFEMEMYNADGSRGEMCGNGVRCVAKYVYEKGMTDKKEILIKSCGRLIYLFLVVDSEDVCKNSIRNPEICKACKGRVKSVRVNMGTPEFAPDKIPVTECESREMAIKEPIQVAGKLYEMTCVSMGNPHAVVFVEDLKNFPVKKVGPWFENHPRFPKRTNVEFVEVLDNATINMRVWERGAGETLACGTGACASVVACVLNKLTDSKVVVKLLGGQLEICWDRKQNVIYMEGPAETVFEGEW